MLALIKACFGVCSSRAQNSTTMLITAMGQIESGARASGKSAPEANSARKFCPRLRRIIRGWSRGAFADFDYIDLAIITISYFKTKVLNAD